MAAKLAYTKCKPGAVSSALDKIFGSFGDETRFARASNVNFFLPLSSQTKLAEIDELIFDLAQLHASRFFILCQDQSKNDFDVEIAALCQQIAKGQHSCAEIVRIFYPQKLEAALPSVVQASLLTGTASELFIYDSEISESLLFRLLSLSERVFFDSQLLARQIWNKQSKLTPEFLRVRAQLIDLQWIGLGVWKEQIKNVFSKAVFAELIPELASVTFRVAAGEEAACSELNLLRGWLAERLKLRLKSKQGDVINLHGPGGKSVQFKLSRDSGGPGGSGLREVSMSFNPKSARIAAAQNQVVSWYREDGMLVTLVSAGTGYRVSQPLEESSWLSALKRYLLIGESTSNYLPALRTAFELE